MRFNIVQFVKVTLKGFTTAIFIHGFAVLGLTSAEATWHFMGHAIGVGIIHIMGK